MSPRVILLLSCLLVAGCHSASTPAPQPAQPAVTTAAAQPAPAPAAAPAKLACKGLSKDDAQGADFVESGALFVLMQSKLGGWTSCQSKHTNKTDEVTTVTFPHGGVLTVSSFPSSDAAEQQATLDAGSSLTAADAIKALKQDNPADGCGVNWSKLSGGATATGDFTASGTTCTLEVHVKQDKGSVVAFGFGVAS